MAFPVFGGISTVADQSRDRIEQGICWSPDMIASAHAPTRSPLRQAGGGNLSIVSGKRRSRHSSPIPKEPPCHPMT